ncbi:MAG: BlaB/IND/MUS family subclass B1 metallo-beta-lactamase, partial [Cytophagales bacterium]|nr:BlaB/IND/MUS family subclass B1 metallo-beta-lactamase [Cytophagales bacterium]
HSIKVFFAIFLVSMVGYAQQPKIQITQLTDGFYVFTTYQSFKGTPFPSNGMYVVTEEGVVIIDTPWDTSQFQPLLDSIQWRHKHLAIMCLATHFHEDRTGGLDYYKLKGIKTYATKRTDNLCIERNEKRAELLIENDTVFAFGKYSFKTYYPGHGHTPDNIVIWFPEQKILYGGCLIKSLQAKELGNLADARVNQWKKSIHAIQRKFGEPNFIVPGHQDWASNQSLTHTLHLIDQYQKNGNR